MNIHGLKLHKKIITEKIKKELAKPTKYQDYRKVQRLTRTRSNYSNQIRELKQRRDNNGTSKR